MRYDCREVARIAGVSESQVRYWARTGLVASERDGGRLGFDFQALVALRTVKSLLDRGVSLRRVRKALARLRSVLPGSGAALSGVRVDVEGEELVFVRDNLRFTPAGQLLIDFGPEGGGPGPVARVDGSEALFFEGLELEEAGDRSGARECYEAALGQRSDHADAWVNLGNLEHARGDPGRAERCYRRALDADPEHAEGSYNLANLLEERGDLDGAVLLYRRALREDPEFADAHFNLARALERSGDLTGARRHWRRYLALDPVGEWAAYVRTRLGG